MAHSPTHRLDRSRQVAAPRRGATGSTRRRSEALGREVPGWATGALVLGTLAAILWLEQRRPLRRARQDKLHRDARNLAMAAMTAAAVRLGEKPFTALLARKVHERAGGSCRASTCRLRSRSASPCCCSITRSTFVTSSPVVFPFYGVFTARTTPISISAPRPLSAFISWRCCSRRPSAPRRSRRLERRHARCRLGRRLPSSPFCSTIPIFGCRSRSNAGSAGSSSRRECTAFTIRSCRTKHGGEFERGCTTCHRC
jgi:hypothetical protein